jgi:hypothetical protein
MDIPPSHQKRVLMFGDDFHSATNIASLHVFRPDQRRRAIAPSQIDLGVAVAEYMHVRRLMIVQEDYEA